jgi:hypothetical protein
MDSIYPALAAARITSRVFLRVSVCLILAGVGLGEDLAFRRNKAPKYKAL